MQVDLFLVAHHDAENITNLKGSYGNISQAHTLLYKVLQSPLHTDGSIPS